MDTNHRLIDGSITTWDLEGGTICVQKGTTTELNLADVMATEGISYTPAVFDDVNATYGAYAEGRCDAATSDKSQLSSVAKGLLSDPENHVIMDLTLSKEPLGPVVRHGDDQWFDIAKWVIFATMAAEEYGVTSANVDDLKSSSTNPEILRLLGVEGDMGLKLGLSNDWAYNVIKQWAGAPRSGRVRRLSDGIFYIHLPSLIQALITLQQGSGWNSAVTNNHSLRAHGCHSAERQVHTSGGMNALRIFGQIVFLVILLLFLGALIRNMLANLQQQGLGLGFDMDITASSTSANT
jgi:hypothetical protein